MQSIVGRSLSHLSDLPLKMFLVAFHGQTKLRVTMKLETPKTMAKK